MQAIKDQFEDYAKDAKLNLSSILSEEGAPGLTQKQIAGTALTCALTLRDEELAQAITQEFESLLDEKDHYGIRAAISLMAMNNVYYRYMHLSEDAELSKMPAKLRMNVMREPGIEKKDFEIYSLAASTLSGCGMCIQAHNRGLKKLNVSAEGIQSVARIAAIINSASQSLWLANTSNKGV